MVLKKGKYQYKRVAFEITDATTFENIKWVLSKFPELENVILDNPKPKKEKVSDNNNEESSKSDKSKAKSK